VDAAGWLTGQVTGRWPGRSPTPDRAGHRPL